MPLSQRDQYSDRKGMRLVRLGAVVCLAAVVFGTVCMTIVATIGEGEDPPKIFEQMGGAACGVFALGIVIGFVGWLISLNQPEPPKPTIADQLAKAGRADELQSDSEPGPDADAGEAPKR
ncbi:MAG: hypothetical protein ACPGYV_08045 [Phycisphaeraceae bacterium]